MTFAEDLRSRNFGIYGQWTGVISIIVCFAVGLSSLITSIVSFSLLFIFAILALITSFLVLFIEIPFLLRILPTSEKFDTFIRKFGTNWLRAAFYGVCSALQFVSITVSASALIAAAVLLLFAGLFYMAAAIKGQAFQSSKTLGGQGVAQMIV